ncbi:MAG: hypothetical protein F6K50_02555 [Moorea sp. SIO3I7]|nr:hypothetical protein [Moorena sp. SIO3I7]
MIFNDNNGTFSYTPHPTPDVKVKNLPLSATPNSRFPTADPNVKNLAL